MPKSPTRTILAAVIAAGGLSLVAQATRPMMAPLSPEFVAWRQRKLEQQQRRGFAKMNVSIEGHRLGYIPEPMELTHLQKNTQSDVCFLAQAPASYDLRTQNALTAVRNQNPFGTCWAFSAMASLESTLLKTGASILDFSEWHLAYFARNAFSVNLPAFTKGNADYGDDSTFDQGGNSSMSTALLSRGTGPVSEAACPYQNTKPYSANTLPKGTEPSVAALREALYLGTAFDATTVKTALMSHGALATPIFWDDACYRSSTHAYRRLNPTDTTHKNETNHLVNIVGWDDAYAKTNFPTGNQPTVDGAWIVRNSWGPSWGEAGYFYMSYDTYVHGAVAFRGTTQTTGRIYQYDPLGAISYLSIGAPTASFANVFTAKASENLQSVAFYAMAPGTYEVSVKTGITSDPSTGTFVAAPQTGSFEASGYHTVDLTTPVALTAGQKFAVLVKLTTPGNNYTIPVEYAETDYSDAATANPGEGYISEDGTTWEDISTGWKSSASICLKAIAAPTASGPTALTSFAPASGGPGSTVTLSGSGFTGATAVTFNGVPASYAISGDWEIVATVPATATTGPIAVTSPSGTATSSSIFTITASQIAVVITPQILGYVVGQTKQFTATVTGAANTAVTWSSTPTGLVSATGLFTAPAAATSVTLTATSAADVTKAASLSFPVRDRNLNLSSDSAVDVLDLATLSKYYGATGLVANDAAAVCDLNGDGTVNDDDITLFFAGF